MASYTSPAELIRMAARTARWWSTIRSRTAGQPLRMSQRHVPSQLPVSWTIGCSSLAVTQTTPPALRQRKLTCRIAEVASVLKVRPARKAPLALLAQQVRQVLLEQKGTLGPAVPLALKDR